MELRDTNILHLKLVSEQGRCVVKDCNKLQQRRVGGSDFYVLCAGHRKLARDRYCGFVPKDYMPSGRSVFPEHPICAIVGCGGYCVYKRTSNYTGERYFSRYCPSHIKINSRSGRPKKRYTNYNLPLPPLIDDSPLTVKCEVNGCKKLVTRHKRTGVFRKRCKKHQRLKRLGLPDNYVYVRPIKEQKRGKCIVDDCDKLQANKGMVGGKRRYSVYCETHRRQHLRLIQRPVKYNLNKCSLCGWVGPCDKHRIVNGKDGGKYTIGNVIVVCPNCHRLIHRGLIAP